MAGQADKTLAISKIAANKKHFKNQAITINKTNFMRDSGALWIIIFDKDSVE